MSSSNLAARTMASMTTSDAHPYTRLTPDLVLDALESVGLRGDGRLLALNRYENRVYQAHIEDAPPVVVKFYRPGRWSDAQIREEHAFVGALAECEIPVVAPLALGGDTLHHFKGFRLAVYARCGVQKDCGTCQNEIEMIIDAVKNPELLQAAE